MWVLNSFLPGVGNSPIKKLPGGFARRGGGWSGLELTDTLIKNTALNTEEISLPCASAYCLTDPNTGTTMPKHSISKDESLLRRHIFLPLYWQSLPPVLTCIDSKEHFHYYFTQIPSYFDILHEISVFSPYRS